MPEIAGPLIDYFSPTSTNECLAAIVKMLKPEYLKQAKDKLSRYSPTSWDHTFNEIFNYLKETNG